MPPRSPRFDVGLFDGTGTEDRSEIMTILMIKRFEERHLGAAEEEAAYKAGVMLVIIS